MPLHPTFERAYPADQPMSGFETVWIAISSDTCVAVVSTSAGIELPTSFPSKCTEGVNGALILGRMGKREYRACRLKTGELHEEFSLLDLRKLYGQVSEEEWFIAGYANQILNWEETSKFCPVCGGETEPMQKEWMRRCTDCAHERYPQVCPALLILVHDGDDGILMAHKPGWGERYSIFAGFVLPGESLEECVHREVQEEAGVLVTNLAYGGSQPWPFPHQLMIGFHAQYVSGDIVIDQEELDDARWFRSDALPALPGPLSLSRQMIDSWAAERAGR